MGKMSTPAISTISPTHCNHQPMDFAVMTERARTVRQEFARFEQRRHGRPWTPEEIMLGFVGDVGDLAKLVQGTAGVRPTDDLDTKLAHELADCLWSVVVLADCFAIDLEDAFDSTMAQLQRWLDAAIAEDTSTRARAGRTDPPALDQTCR